MEIKTVPILSKRASSKLFKMLVMVLSVSCYNWRKCAKNAKPSHNHILYIPCSYTVKPVYNGHSLKERKLVFKTNYRLMHVKSIAECSKSILQYFRPSFSYNFPLRSLFCLFLSARFIQVLMYSFYHASIKKFGG